MDEDFHLQFGDVHPAKSPTSQIASGESDFLLNLKDFHVTNFGGLPDGLQSFPPVRLGKPVNLRHFLDAALRDGGMDSILREGRWGAFWRRYWQKAEDGDEVEAPGAARSSESHRAADERVQMDCIACLHPYQQQALTGKASQLGKSTIQLLLNNSAVASASLGGRTTSSSSSSSSSACAGSEQEATVMASPAAELSGRGIMFHQDVGNPEFWDHSSVGRLSPVVGESCSVDIPKDEKPGGKAVDPCSGRRSGPRTSRSLSIELSVVTEDPMVVYGTSSADDTAITMGGPDDKQDAKALPGRIRSSWACQHEDHGEDMKATCALALLRLKNHKQKIPEAKPGVQRTSTSEANNNLDFSLIQDRLNSGWYASSGAFADEVRRTLKACLEPMPKTPEEESFQEHVLAMWRSFEADVLFYGMSMPEPVPATLGCKAGNRDPSPGVASTEQTDAGLVSEDIGHHLGSPFLSCSSGGEKEEILPMLAALSGVNHLRRAGSPLSGVEAGETGAWLPEDEGSVRSRRNPPEQQLGLGPVAAPVKRPRSCKQTRKRKAPGPSTLEPFWKEQGSCVEESCARARGCLPVQQASQNEARKNFKSRMIDAREAEKKGAGASEDGLAAVGECPEELDALEVLSGLLCSSTGCGDSWEHGSCVVPKLHQHSRGGRKSTLLSSAASSPLKDLPDAHQGSLLDAPAEAPMGPSCNQHGVGDAEDGAAASVLASLAAFSQQEHGPSPGRPHVFEEQHTSGFHASPRTNPKATLSLSALLVHKLMGRSGTSALAVSELTDSEDDLGPLSVGSTASGCHSFILSRGERSATQSACTVPPSCSQGDQGDIELQGKDAGLRLGTAPLSQALHEDSSVQKVPKLKSARTHLAMKGGNSFASAPGEGGGDHPCTADAGSPEHDVQGLGSSKGGLLQEDHQEHDGDLGDEVGPLAGSDGECSPFPFTVLPSVTSGNAARTMGLWGRQGSRRVSSPSSPEQLQEPPRSPGLLDACDGSAARVRGYDWSRSKRMRRASAEETQPMTSSEDQESGPRTIASSNATVAAATPVPEESCLPGEDKVGSGVSPSADTAPARLSEGCARTNLPFCWSSRKQTNFSQRRSQMLASGVVFGAHGHLQGCHMPGLFPGYALAPMVPAHGVPFLPLPPPPAAAPGHFSLPGSHPHGFQHFHESAFRQAGMRNSKQPFSGWHSPNNGLPMAASSCQMLNDSLFHGFHGAPGQQQRSEECASQGSAPNDTTATRKGASCGEWYPGLLFPGLHSSMINSLMGPPPGAFSQGPEGGPLGVKAHAAAESRDESTPAFPGRSALSPSATVAIDRGSTRPSVCLTVIDSKVIPMVSKATADDP